MKTLVLCVDRDNDFGRKVGIKTPLIGREGNLKAAIGLGLKDAEDADTNALLKAISIYDEFIDQGKDVELATICGDVNVGTASDMKLTEELQIVLEVTNADSVVLVSDGAEDEYILPLLTSRIRVDSVVRVIVKQAQNIENAYYMLAKALKDEKVQKKFIIPVGLVLLVLSIAVLGDYSHIGWAIVGLVLAIYLLVRAFNLEAALWEVAEEFEAGLKTGRVTLFTSLLALLVFIIGVVLAYSRLYGQEFTIYYVATFIGTVLWWAIASALISIVGKVIDTYIKERRVLWSYWRAPFSLALAGLIISVAIDVITKAHAGPSVIITPDIIFKIGLIAFVGFIGISTYRYIREHVIIEEVEWRR